MVRYDNIHGLVYTYHNTRTQVVELNAQRANRKFQLCTRVCSSLYAHLGYFQQGHNVIEDIQPQLSKLNDELTLARKEFSRKGEVYVYVPSIPD